MGTTNFGLQTISFDFAQEGTSQGFNKLNYKLFPKGVYEGGLITYKDANTVTIAPLVNYIEDSSVGLGVRVETTIAVDIAIIEATPYIIARFVWADVDANYMDFFVKAFGDLVATDIIIGKGEYIGGVLQTDILYDERTISVLTQSLGKFYYGTVDPTGTQRLNYDGHFHATQIINSTWGDLAEYFPKYKYQLEIPGRVYRIDNFGEAVLTYKKADKNVLGVCSDSAGYILKEEYKENGVCIGLSGTVKVIVNSEIKKGDFLVSDKNGYAKKATIFDKIFRPEAIFGKALENHTPNELCPTYEEKILMLIK